MHILRNNINISAAVSSKFNQTFILTGCCKYIYSSVCIWYDASFTQIKQYNAHEVTLRAVLEMLLMSSFSEMADAEVTASVTRFSLWTVNRIALSNNDQSSLLVEHT